MCPTQDLRLHEVKERTCKWNLLGDLEWFNTNGRFRMPTPDLSAGDSRSIFSCGFNAPYVEEGKQHVQIQG